MVNEAEAARLGSQRATIVAAVAGVLWPVLAITRLFLTSELDRPDWDQPRADVVDFYARTDFDTRFVVGIALVAIAYLLLLVFVAKLASVVSSNGDAPWVGSLLIGLTVVTVGFTFCYLIAFATAVFGSSEWGASEDTVLALNGFSFASYWFALPVDTFFQVTLGTTILTTGWFPKWIGWVLVATGVGELMAFFGPVPAWNALSGLPYIWILVLALIMLRQPERYSGSAMPAGAR